MIIDHHEHNHYDIVDVIWFAVIDDTECDVSYVDVECGTGDIQSISGGSGKPFVILLNYKNCISYRTHCKSVCKKWFYMISIWLCLSKYLILLSARNCVCLFPEILSIFLYFLL